MATTATQVGIKASWTLLSFANNKRIQIAPFENKDTKEKFKSLVFTDKTDGSRTLVAFSSKLGELTPAQMSAMKMDLQIVQLESGNYKLCKQGENTWEEVTL